MVNASINESAFPGSRDSEGNLIESDDYIPLYSPINQTYVGFLNVHNFGNLTRDEINIFITEINNPERINSVEDIAERNTLRPPAITEGHLV